MMAAASDAVEPPAMAISQLTTSTSSSVLTAFFDVKSAFCPVSLAIQVSCPSQRPRVATTGMASSMATSTRPPPPYPHTVDCAGAACCSTIPFE